MDARTYSILAVDGGGTKCRAVVADERGSWIGEGITGSSNYQSVGKEAAKREIFLAIKEAFTAAGIVHEEMENDGMIEFHCAVFALAGLDTSKDRIILTELVQDVLHKLHIKVGRLVIENDGFAALLGATEGEPGVLVIAGTGSIVYGMNKDGASVRAGGWGHRVGDEGSGYWMGKKAIKSVLKAMDGRGRPTLLTDRILSHLHLNNAEELYNWVYSPNYSIERVAQLSHLVSQTLKDGDEVSLLLFQEAAEELYQGVAAVVRQLGLERGRFLLILQGGVLQYEPYLRDLMIKRIRSHFASVQLDSAKKEPIYGVISMGLKHLS